MAFYHDLITEKSWEELQTLGRRVRFVLIGGWATYLYTKALKSKDIDIIIDYDQLPILQKNYAMTKNDRLKKYEAKRGPVEIDIYLPHFSALGIPVEDLLPQARMHEGFRILNPETLLALKLYTLVQRGRSSKGRKDFLDIISLFRLPDVSVGAVKTILEQYQLDGVWENFTRFLKESSDLPELELNKHQFSKIRKKLVP